MTDPASNTTSAPTLGFPQGLPDFRHQQPSDMPGQTAGVELLDHLFLLGVTMLATGAIDRTRRSEVLAALRILAGATSDLARERLLRVSNLAIVAAAGMKLSEISGDPEQVSDDTAYAERIVNSPEVRRLRQILDEAAAA